VPAPVPPPIGAFAQSASAGGAGLGIAVGAIMLVVLLAVVIACRRGKLRFPLGEHILAGSKLKVMHPTCSPTESGSPSTLDSAGFQTPTTARSIDQTMGHILRHPPKLPPPDAAMDHILRNPPPLPPPPDQPLPPLPDQMDILRNPPPLPPPGALTVDADTFDVFDDDFFYDDGGATERRLRRSLGSPHRQQRGDRPDAFDQQDGPRLHQPSEDNLAGYYLPAPAGVSFSGATVHADIASHEHDRIACTSSDAVMRALSKVRHDMDSAMPQRRTPRTPGRTPRTPGGRFTPRRRTPSFPRTPVKPRAVPALDIPTAWAEVGQAQVELWPDLVDASSHRSQLSSRWSQPSSPCWSQPSTYRSQASGYWSQPSSHRSHPTARDRAQAYTPNWQRPPSARERAGARTPSPIEPSDASANMSTPFKPRRVEVRHPVTAPSPTGASPVVLSDVADVPVLDGTWPEVIIPQRRPRAGSLVQYNNTSSPQVDAVDPSSSQALRMVRL